MDRGLRAAVAVGLSAFGLVASAVPTSAATATNPAPITIGDFANATPYPATISVSGLSGQITDLNVSINGLTHDNSADVGAVLVSPFGQSLILLSDVGGANDTTNSQVIFSDGAPELGTGTLTTGTFKPTDRSAAPLSFPAPGPLTSYGRPGPGGGGTATLASTFNGLVPNGVWSLYVRDFASNGSTGVISGGWSLDMTGPVPLPTGGPVTAPGQRAAALKKCKKKKSKKARKKCKKKAQLLPV